MQLTPGRSMPSLAQVILFRNQCFYLENGANKNLALSGPQRVTVTGCLPCMRSVISFHCCQGFSLLCLMSLCLGNKFAQIYSI